MYPTLYWMILQMLFVLFIFAVNAYDDADSRNPKVNRKSDTNEVRTKLIYL